jgi:hypothetical protein
MSNPKPVFLISGAANTRPLWPGLAEHFRLAFIAPAAEQVARENGIDVISPSQFFTSEIRERVLSDALNLTSDIIRDMPVLSERIVNVYGHGVPPALNSKLPEWFTGFIHERILGQVTTIAVLENMVKSESIVGCLVHEDVTPDMRSIVLYCKASRIPTIHLPHAACHLLPGIEDIHRQTRTDWILTSGRYMTQFYRDCGVADWRMIEVGLPEWEGVYDSNLPDKAEARRVLGLPDRLTLNYGTTWGQTTSLRSTFEVEFEESFLAVVELAKARDANLIVNMHPNEAPQREQVYADKMKAAGLGGPGRIVTRTHKVYTTMAADVVVCHGPSNLCIKAAMMGRPSCYIQTEGFDFAHTFPPRGQASDLPALVDSALAVADWDNFIETYAAGYKTGGETTRTIEAILQICKVEENAVNGQD